MAHFRVSPAAQADLQTILDASRERWGIDGRDRYAQALSAAIHAVADDPRGPMTRAREELLAGLRSLHLRHADKGHGVRAPVHIVFYRVAEPDVIEIVRVLHERMDPVRHLDDPKPARKPRRR